METYSRDGAVSIHRVQRSLAIQALVRRSHSESPRQQTHLLVKLDETLHADHVELDVNQTPLPLKFQISLICPAK